MKPSPILLPFSWLYGAAVKMRNVFFDSGLRPSKRLPLPVISVGNISAGGTGKTPFVMELVAILKEWKRRSVIVSRGYGRMTKGFQVVSNGFQQCAEAVSSGDEPAMLAELLPGTPVVVDEDRVRGGLKSTELFSPDVVILDDGFQHRRLFRDLDIVLISAREVLKGSMLLPAGYGREPISSLRRAHVIGISRCRDREEWSRASDIIRSRFPIPVLWVQNSVTYVTRQPDGERMEPETLKGKKAVVVSGIADPASFDRTARDLGLTILAHRRFGDHHWYSRSEVAGVVHAARKDRADVVVTTEKDMVRLRDFREEWKDVPLFSVGIRANIAEGKEALNQAVSSLSFGKGN